MIHKFRVWDTKKEEFDYCPIMESCIHEIQLNDMDEYMQNEHMLIESYTNVCDKEGNELYENDVVLVKRLHAWEKHIVEFADGLFFAGYNYGSSTVKRKRLLRSCDLLKIGDIHSNPNILK
jgi:hypothetical protein